MKQKQFEPNFLAKYLTLRIILLPGKTKGIFYLVGKLPFLVEWDDGLKEEIELWDRVKIEYSKLFKKIIGHDLNVEEIKLLDAQWLSKLFLQFSANLENIQRDKLIGDKIFKYLTLNSHARENKKQ